jgi:hypothetical protein
VGRRLHLTIDQSSGPTRGLSTYTPKPPYRDRRLPSRLSPDSRRCHSGGPKWLFRSHTHLDNSVLVSERVGIVRIQSLLLSMLSTTFSLLDDQRTLKEASEWPERVHEEHAHFSNLLSINSFTIHGDFSSFHTFIMRSSDGPVDVAFQKRVKLSVGSLWFWHW